MQHPRAALLHGPRTSPQLRVWDEARRLLPVPSACQMLPVLPTYCPTPTQAVTVLAGHMTPQGLSNTAMSLAALGPPGPQAPTLPGTGAPSPLPLAMSSLPACDSDHNICFALKPADASLQPGDKNSLMLMCVPAAVWKRVATDGTLLPSASASITGRTAAVGSSAFSGAIEALGEELATRKRSSFITQVRCCDCWLQLTVDAPELPSWLLLNVLETTGSGVAVGCKFCSAGAGHVGYHWRSGMCACCDRHESQVPLGFVALRTCTTRSVCACPAHHSTDLAGTFRHCAAQSLLLHPQALSNLALAHTLSCTPGGPGFRCASAW